MRLALLIILLFASTSAHADPVTAAVAAFVVWAGVSAATVYLVGATVLLSVGTAVYGAAQARRAARDARNQMNAAMQDRMATRIASESPHRYVYGRARVGSDIVAMFTSGDKDQYKHIVCVLTAHECDAVEEVYVNNVAVGLLNAQGDATGGRYAVTPGAEIGEEAHVGPSFTLRRAPISGSVKVFAGHGADAYEIASTVSGRNVTIDSGDAVTVSYEYRVNRRFDDSVDESAVVTTIPYVRVQIHLGTPDDPADAYLMSVVPDKWPATAVLRGLCYLVVTLDLNNPEFQNGQVPIQALVRGRKPYDPRTGVTTWSANPALAVRDYLTSQLCGVPASDLPDAQFITAANVCDESVVPGGRYTINGTVTSDQDQAHVLEAMAQCMAGGIVSTSWDIYAGKYIAPVMVLEQSDIVGGVSITPGASDASIYNGVKGQYLSEENGYVLTDFKPYQNDVYRAADERDLYTNIDFPFTNTAQRVTNLARIFTEDMRNGFTLKAEFNLKAWPLKVGQRIAFNSDFFGQAAKVYRITDKSYSPNSAVELTMKEDSASIWDFADAVELDSTPNTNLPDPWLIDPLVSIACTSGLGTLLKQADGTIVPRILATWPAVSTQAVFTNGEIEIEWRAIGTETWQKTKVSGSETEAYLSPITPGWFYVVRGRAVNPYLNTKSDWVSATYQVAVISTTATVYKWASEFPSAPAGAATLDWPTGQFGAAPLGWSLTEPATPATNSILWAATVSISDISATAPTPFDWSSASIASVRFTSPAAATLYTWVKYGTSAAGAGLTDNPDGMSYMGLAYNKTSPVESTDPADYAWSLIKGTDGTPVKGDPGINGVTLYTWIKYADLPDGTGLYDAPTASTLYLGLAVNKTVPEESTLKTDYVWSKFKGDQGVPGAGGAAGSAGGDGSRGAGTYYATNGAWSIFYADAATPGPNVVDDLVTISNGSTFTLTRRWNGSAWVDIGTVIDGNLLVSGSVGSSKVDTRGLSVRDLAGNVLLGVGVPLDPSLAAEGTKNSEQTLGALGQDSFRVVAAGGVAINLPGSLGVYLNGVLSFEPGPRGYTLLAINRTTRNPVWLLTYDVYGAGELSEGRTATHLANDLNAMGPDVIAVIFTSDEAKENRLTGGLDTAMYRCGASRAVFGSPNVQFRSAYILVGIPGCGEGGGAEFYQGTVPNDANAWCDIGFSVCNGAITGVSANYSPKSLTDYGYTGDYDATAGATWGVNVEGANKPADNATSDITLLARGSVSVIGNVAKKTAGTANDWDSDCYSRESYAGGAHAQAQIVADGFAIMFGLNRDPWLDGSFGSLDYAVYFRGNGSIGCYESGADRGTIGYYVSGDVLAVAYDGSNVRYLRNGAVLRTVETFIAEPLYFDSSFASPDGALSNIRFTPMSSNAWSAIGGANKAADNATVGAPPGTSVGGTEAGLLASRALNGDAAYNAVNDAATGLATRLRSNAVNVLSGGGAVTVGSLTVDASGNRTGGSGIGMTGKGIALYAPGGAATITMDAATGNAGFGGTLTAADMVNTSHIVSGATKGFDTFGTMSSYSGGGQSIFNMPVAGGDILILANVAYDSGSGAQGYNVEFYNGSGWVYVTTMGNTGGMTNITLTNAAAGDYRLMGIASYGYVTNVTVFKAKV